MLTGMLIIIIIAIIIICNLIIVVTITIIITTITIISIIVNSPRSEVAVAAISPQETEADYESDFELDKVNHDDGHDGDEVLDDDGHGDFELDKVNQTLSKTTAVGK